MHCNGFIFYAYLLDPTSKANCELDSMCLGGRRARIFVGTFTAETSEGKAYKTAEDSEKGRVCLGQTRRARFQFHHRSPAV